MKHELTQFNLICEEILLEARKQSFLESFSKKWFFEDEFDAILPFILKKCVLAFTNFYEQGKPGEPEITSEPDIELIDENYVEFTIMPKGFGSENNNALKMALPAEGIEGVKDFVVETALKAGGKPCPPIVVGVGIGGSSDMALKLGKKALLGKVGQRNPDPTIAEMELECLERINKDGKGPMGLGGRTTALDVKILKMDTHTAGLPVGVVIQCWADRHATARLEDN